MKVFIPATGLLLLSATASAFAERRFMTGDEFDKACENKVRNGTSVSRLCYEGSMLVAECVFGSETFDPKEATEETPKEQQKCLCGSEIWDIQETCMSCYRHVETEPSDDPLLNVNIKSMSSDYCRNRPATVGFPEWQSGWLEDNTATLETASSVLSSQTAVNTGATMSSKAATASQTELLEPATGTATGAASATTTGAASSLREHVGLLALMTGLSMAAGLLG